MPKKASYITVYRIGHPHYIDRLDGEGAAISGGRWNEKGQRVVYTSQTSSLAILELLGHISDFYDPVPYQLIAIKVSTVSLLHYQELSAKLPDSWKEDRAGKKICLQIGREWLNEKLSAVPQVPSVHNLLEYNFLLNPAHPEFEAKIIEEHWYLYDGRLKNSY